MLFLLFFDPKNQALMLIASFSSILRIVAQIKHKSACPFPFIWFSTSVILRFKFPDSFFSYITYCSYSLGAGILLSFLRILAGDSDWQAFACNVLMRSIAANSPLQIK